MNAPPQPDRPADLAGPPPGGKPGSPPAAGRAAARLPREQAAGQPRAAIVVGDNAARRPIPEEAQRPEQDFRGLFESIPEVFWLIDVEKQKVLYVSPGYEVIWGRTSASLYESVSTWIESIYAEDRQRVLDTRMAKQIQEGYNETYRIVRPDGAIRWIRDRSFPVRDEGGVVRRIVGIAEDITERKKLEEQFLRAQRLESIGMLAAGIAHDLNNVLAPIGMATPLLRAHATRPGDLKLLDTLERCGTRGAGLVRQILGFVHGIGGEPRVVQIKHLFHDIIGVVTETFPKSIVVDQNIPNDLWPILANPTQIHQVLLNLCVNARDAMPSGGILRLRGENRMLDESTARMIEGGKPGAWLVLHVEDTGTGIPPEVLARIWDPFFTTKAPENGTGLGLSTVRGIVETHHGFITLASDPGRGTTFRVYLPAAECAVASEQKIRRPAARHGRNELVLVVDDEEPILAAIRGILSAYGYRVITAKDGEKAAELFAERAAEIALVITDRDMPTLGGSGLARTIHAQCPAMKILMISGGNAGQGTRSHLEKHDSGFLAKPFAAQALLEAVDGLLRGREESPEPGPEGGTHSRQ